MSYDTIAGYTVSALVASGGLIGFLKAGSTPSLVAGGGSGAALAYGVYRAHKNPQDVLTVVGVSVGLLALMGNKYMKSGKFMPAGLISLLSLGIAARFGSRML